MTLKPGLTQKMQSLPRTEAKSNVRRFTDKVIYELSTPGVQSVNDIFISRTENGYEIKALGRTKVYVNNLQINLPITKFSIKSGKLVIEFKLEEEASLL